MDNECGKCGKDHYQESLNGYPKCDYCCKTVDGGKGSICSACKYDHEPEHYDQYHISGGAPGDWFN